MQQPGSTMTKSVRNVEKTFIYKVHNNSSSTSACMPEQQEEKQYNTILLTEGICPCPMPGYEDAQRQETVFSATKSRVENKLTFAFTAAVQHCPVYLTREELKMKSFLCFYPNISLLADC